MDVFEAIDRRHSYRGNFTDHPVPREDLQRIVQAGIQAPSGRNAQTTTFVIVDDTERVQEVGEILEKPNIRSAKALIVAVMEERVVFNGLCKLHRFFKLPRLRKRKEIFQTPPSRLPSTAPKFLGHIAEKVVFPVLQGTPRSVMKIIRNQFKLVKRAPLSLEKRASPQGLLQFVPHLSFRQVIGE